MNSMYENSRNSSVTSSVGWLIEQGYLGDMLPWTAAERDKIATAIPADWQAGTSPDGVFVARPASVENSEYQNPPLEPSAVAYRHQLSAPPDTPSSEVLAAALRLEASSPIYETAELHSPIKPASSPDVSIHRLSGTYLTANSNNRADPHQFSNKAFFDEYVVIGRDVGKLLTIIVTTSTSSGPSLSLDVLVGTLMATAYPKSPKISKQSSYGA